MKYTGSVTAALALMAGLSCAFPAMEELMKKMPAEKRAGSTELIGDLATLQDGQLTQTGKDVKAILQGQASGMDTTSSYKNVSAKGTPECAKDTCCIWKYIADDMRKAMVGDAGRCNDVARGAVRLGFHDAGTWSKTTAPGGGADGSTVLAGECETRSENNGLQAICSQMRQWFNQYKAFNITMADLIQMGANVGTVACPLGPRVRSFVGRKDSSTPSPQGNIPSPFDGADKLISLFADKTINADGLVALVGAHSTAQQRFVDPKRAGDPLDTTPGVWDTNFYGEVLEPKAPKRVFKFQSDIALSNDSRTSGTWKAFVGTGGQGPWDGAYSGEYVRLSLLGVNNINDMTECTKVLPPFTPTFTSPDQPQLSQFLNNNNTAETQQSSQLMGGNKINYV
ncbi:peroxidase domain-containing protein [Hirsutella rhossiliensis]|uniref:Peroxidase n=1 Tax=Hirsutella rhossiliensis TaxID=111463 RepID=A0A9P8MS92_9HYPO|nr:peroxidase domain-containing protein [Hirsutella rhossiliensis]KAH0960270.1 peroxidase domain-containing protein [Hirsutella rhossiliensis]